MKNSIRKFMLLAFCLINIANLFAQQKNNIMRQIVYFVKQDGLSAYNLDFFTQYKQEDISGYTNSANLDSFLYIFPNNYDFIINQENSLNGIQFKNSFGYSLMKSCSFNKGDLDVVKFKKDKDGNFILTLGEFIYKRPDNADYKDFTFVFVLPNNFIFNSYKCNKNGKWVKRNNTVSFFGQNINNLTFTIEYKPVPKPKTDTVTVTKIDTVVIIKPSVNPIANIQEKINRILNDKILFNPGSAEILPLGHILLDSVSSIIKSTDSINVILEGYTDNIPIATKEFPTNWDLSSARILSVLKYLIKSGVKSSIIEFRGYGENKPLASNDTKDGRAKNRRIEINLISTKKSKK